MTEWLVLLSPWLALACLIIWDGRDQGRDAQPESEQNAVSPDFAALIDTMRKEGRANRKEESREDRGKRFREYLTLLFVIATTAGVFYQAYIFSGQLTEMKSSGEQTTKLIENNAVLAASAAKQAEATDKQADAMNASVEVSRESLIASGRTWVGPRLELSLKVGDGGNGQVVFPSTGFSAYNLTLTIPNQTIDQETIDGDKTLIVQGCFLYRSFKVIRHSYFCYFYRAKTTKPDNLNICTAGHYAD